MGRQQDRAAALTEAIYDAAVDPVGWAEVMVLVRESFASDVETLYSLDYARRRIRPIEVTGIGQRFLDSLESSLYTDDNPSTRTPALHRPGVVRTDQRLGEYFRDPGILRRSRYFVEWMQPQDLCHTMGFTPLTRDGKVINLSLCARPMPGRSAPRRLPASQGCNRTSRGRCAWRRGWRG